MFWLDIEQLFCSEKPMKTNCNLNASCLKRIWPVRRGCTFCKAAKDLNHLFNLSRRSIETTTSQNDLVQLIG